MSDENKTSNADQQVENTSGQNETPETQQVEVVAEPSFAKRAGTAAAGAATSTGKAVGRGVMSFVGRVFSLLFTTKPGLILVLSFFYMNFYYNELTWSLYQYATTTGLSTLWNEGGALNFTILSVAIVGLFLLAVVLIGAFRKMNLLSWLAVAGVMVCIYLPLFYFHLFEGFAREWILELVYASVALALVIKNNKTFMIRWLWGDVGVHQESIDGDESS